MSTKLDLAKVRALLAEVHACDEKIADRGPIKVLPRPSDEIPNVPALRARLVGIQAALRVRRKGAPKGHDLEPDPADGVTLRPIPNRDFKAVGTIEAVQSIMKGADRALPNTDVIVQVGFPNGDHLWFDPDDLATVDKESEASKP